MIESVVITYVICDVRRVGTTESCQEASGRGSVRFSTLTLSPSSLRSRLNLTSRLNLIALWLVLIRLLCGVSEFECHNIEPWHHAWHPQNDHVLGLHVFGLQEGYVPSVQPPPPPTSPTNFPGFSSRFSTNTRHLHSAKFGCLEDARSSSVR